ncbi:MAG: hypothetical protein WBO19_11310 [Terriglobia bacterium]
MTRSADDQILDRLYSNSEQDMKYPQRGQIILQRRDSSRLEQTGQN